MQSLEGNNSYNATLTPNIQCICSSTSKGIYFGYGIYPFIGFLSNEALRCQSFLKWERPLIGHEDGVVVI